VLVVQNAAKPAGIRNAIVDLIALGVTDVRVASAYVTLGGCNILLAAIREGVGQAAFAAIPKTLVTSFDYGITEPQALRRWVNLANSRIKASGATDVAQGSLMPPQAFHPKLYAFRRDAQLTMGSRGSPPGLYAKRTMARSP
jgi:hypothetical protein